MSAVQEPILQAVADAQISAFAQALLEETQVCVVPSQALVVRVEPAHEAGAQEVPPAV
jgi:aspartate/methionine/tyrosine aminotransferase